MDRWDHHVHKREDKNHPILLDAERAFDKTQHPLVINVRKRYILQPNRGNTGQGHRHQPKQRETEDMSLNLKQGRGPPTPFLFNILSEVLARATGTLTKRIQTGKKEEQYPHLHMTRFYI